MATQANPEPTRARELAALPEEFRVPVVLCDVADRTYEDIARTLGVPIGTVRSRIHRGRKLLRGELVTRGVVTAEGVA